MAKFFRRTSCPSFSPWAARLELGAQATSHKVMRSPLDIVILSLSLVLTSSEAAAPKMPFTATAMSRVA